MSTTPFDGFPPETLQFLIDLEANNNRDWFQANKARYEQAYLSPGIDFIAATGSGLQQFAPRIQIDTRANGQGSLMRIYRDVRFSKDKSPYKTSMSGIFNDGQGKKMLSPAFGFYLTRDGMELMTGQFGFDKPQLAVYRTAVADEEQGAELTAVLEDILTAGSYQIQGEQLQRVPRGFDKEHPNADLLRYKGLYVSPQGGLPPAVVTSPDLVPAVLAHFAAMAPLYHWLNKNLAGSD